jgi:hypothetical protein
MPFGLFTMLSAAAAAAAATGQGGRGGEGGGGGEEEACSSPAKGPLRLGVAWFVAHPRRAQLYSTVCVWVCGLAFFDCFDEALLCHPTGNKKKDKDEKGKSPRRSQEVKFLKKKDGKKEKEKEKKLARFATY